MLMARLLPGDEILDKILRYETKFHRLLTQAMDQMAALKARKEDPTAAEGSNALPEA
jgi:hypothetical protein